MTDAQAGIPLKPVHTPLPVVDQQDFAEPVELYRVVSFLNRALKGRGVIIGLSQGPGGVRVSVYDASSGDKAPAR